MSGGIKNKVSLVLKNRNDAGALTGILFPLQQTSNGIEFPYTPTIGIGHSANYGQHDIVHSVSQPNYYVNTPNPTIGITAQFTSNSIEEAKYTAACLHFLKSCTKGEFGEQAGDLAGTPPPVLILSAYGMLHAERIPVVVGNVSYNLTEDVDYVEVESAGNMLTLPTTLLMTIDLKVQQTPRFVRENFDAGRYASGHLLRGGGFM